LSKSLKLVPLRRKIDHSFCNYAHVKIVLTVIITFINSAALSKIRRVAGTCHSVVTKRCAVMRRTKVAVDSVDRRSSAGKLFQISGPERAKFL